jgi:O-acetylserine/cysteine efflux transporter
VAPSAPTAGRLPGRDALILAGVAALWGFNFVPIRWALDAIPPFALAALRFLLAAVPAVFLVRRPRVPLRLLAGYGLAIGAGQFGLLFLAIRLGFPAGLASLLIQVQVFFTIGLAAAVTGDAVARHQAGGALLAASGLAVLVAGHASLGFDALGLLLVLGAAACWAAGNVLAKVAARRHGADMLALVVWSSLAAPLPLAVLSYATEGGASVVQAVAHAGLRAWASVLFMSYAGTLVGFALWNRQLQRHPAALVAPFALLVPVVGLASAGLALGERLGWLEAAAAALVLAGLAVTALGGPRAAPSPAAAANPEP